MSEGDAIKLLVSSTSSVNIPAADPATVSTSVVIEDKQMSCRLLIQQCESARLATSEDANNPQYVDITRGIIIYVSFFCSADEAVARRAAAAALKAKLSETPAGKMASILDLPGSILIIPQACLGGKRKNNLMQYHCLAGKDQGRALYDIFTAEVKNLVSSAPKFKLITDPALKPKVETGTYGNRQILIADFSRGPFSHVIDL